MAGYIPIGGIPNNQVQVDNSNSGNIWKTLGNFGDSLLRANPGGALGTLYSIFGPTPQGQTGSYANHIGSAITPRIPTVQQPQTNTDPTADILAQLQQLQDPSRYMANDAQLHQQALAAAAAQYDPVIAGLRNQAAASTRRGEQAQKDVISIFNQLSDSLHGDLPAIQQNYDQTQAQSGKEYADLKSGIQQQYADSQKQQTDLYKQLNIEAAAPSILPQQQRDADYFTNRASVDSQTQNAALQQERQGAVNFTNAKSQNARTEGTQRSADILSNLNALLEQYNGQISQNEAAKAQTANAMYGQLSTQNQSNALDRAQRDFTNYIQSINLGRGLRSDQLDEQTKLGALNNKPVTSIADIPRRVIGLGLPQQSAQSIQDTFTQGLMSDLVSGGLDPFTGAQATPEAKANQIVETGRQRGLSGQELEALRVAALEYFGRH